MIKVSLYREQVEKMHRDKSLEPFFPANNTSLQSKMTEEEFADFLKENDLIPYKNQLKSYQDGFICGEFTVI